MERFIRNNILKTPSLRGGKADEAIQNGDYSPWIAALPMVARDDDCGGGY